MKKILLALIASLTLAACGSMQPASEAEKLRAWNDPCRTDMGPSAKGWCREGASRFHPSPFAGAERATNTLPQ